MSSHFLWTYFSIAISVMQCKYIAKWSNKYWTSFPISLFLSPYFHFMFQKVQMTKIEFILSHISEKMNSPEINSRCSLCSTSTATADVRALVIVIVCCFFLSCVLFSLPLQLTNLIFAQLKKPKHTQKPYAKFVVVILLFNFGCECIWSAYCLSYSNRKCKWTEWKIWSITSRTSQRNEIQNDIHDIDVRDIKKRM